MCCADENTLIGVTVGLILFSIISTTLGIIITACICRSRYTPTSHHHHHHHHHHHLHHHIVIIITINVTVMNFQHSRIKLFTSLLAHYLTKTTDNRVILCTAFHFFPAFPCFVHSLSISITGNEDNLINLYKKIALRKTYKNLRNHLLNLQF